MKKVLFIGTGAWATALADVLLHNKCYVMMYGIDKKEMSELRQGFNSRCFGHKKMVKKPNIVSNDLVSLLKEKPDYVILAIPSNILMGVVEKIKPLLVNRPIFINVAKGFNLKTNNPISMDIKRQLKGHISGFVSLMGPSFSTEVFNRERTIINVVGSDKPTALKVANLFKTNYFKCSYEKNEVSAEYCAAFKNVMAIACGLTFALHLSINTRAAIFTQSVKEIGVILNKKGLSTKPLFNFCGVGDIFLTCTDEQSRNFQFGKMVAKYGAKKALAMNKATVEGLYALSIAKAIVKEEKISKSPVICALYDVIYNNKPAKTYIQQVSERIIE